MTTNRPFCERRGCTARGYHWPDCSGDCAGCQPRLALDGLRLCRRDAEGIAADAQRAATLHAELALALSGSGAPGEKVSSSGDRSKVVNEAAVSARDEIRAVLSSWCRMIAEERGIHPPKQRVVKLLPLGFIGPPPLVWTVDDTLQAMGKYIATHAEWLAAHPAAGECADELRELAHGRPHRVAYPNGTRRFQVKLEGQPIPCRALVPDDDGGDHPCPGTLWTVLRRTDSLLPSALVCDTDEDHVIPAAEWLTLGRKLRREAA